MHPSSLSKVETRRSITQRFIVPRYSPSVIKAAGQALSGPVLVPLKASPTDQQIEIFSIANNWRDAHAYPLKRIRSELVGKVRLARCQGTTAARIKRMASIRKKLSTSKIALHQMRDLGGGRAILNTIEDVYSLTALYRSGSSLHEVQWDKSYIDQPKDTGYRSNHFALKFNPEMDEERPYAGLRIELQIRTQLQHAWATAVEAIGLVRREDLKRGHGDGNWLRLFALMSSEFALLENTPIVPGTPENSKERRQEIRHLNSVLQAIEELDKTNNAIQYTEFVRGHENYFLITYNGLTRQLSIRGFTDQIAGSLAASNEEGYGKSLTETVLVEVDKAKDLRSAYPNFFLDVGIFTRKLKDILGFSVQPEPKKLDLSWVRGFVKSSQR